MKSIQFVRTPGTPAEPAPFSLNGMPCWTAVLTDREADHRLRQLHLDRPSKMLQAQVAEIWVNGVQVYPVQSTEVAP